MSLFESGMPMNACWHGRDIHNQPQNQFEASILSLESKGNFLSNFLIAVGRWWSLEGQTTSFKQLWVKYKLLAIEGNHLQKT